jgi:hypothetical protein
MVAVTLALAGCASNPAPSASIEVSEAQWRLDEISGGWPFTVPQGVLTCHHPDWITFTANGTEYALSDSARWIGDYPSVAPILRRGYVEINAERQPIPVSVSNHPMTERGRTLCP